MYVAPTYYSPNTNELRQSSRPLKLASPPNKNPCILTLVEQDACNSPATIALLPNYYPPLFLHIDLPILEHKYMHDYCCLTSNSSHLDCLQTTIIPFDHD